MDLSKQYQQGFTLIEIVVVIAVFSIILLGLLSLYGNYNRIYNVQEANSRVIVASSFTGSSLQNDARQANAVLSTHSFSGTIYTSDADTLVMSLPSVDSSGDVILNQYDYIAYYVDGAKLYRRVLPFASSSRSAVTQQLSDTVSTISFTYNNADFAQVSQVGADILMNVTVRSVSVDNRLKQTIYLHNR